MKYQKILLIMILMLSLIIAGCNEQKTQVAKAELTITTGDLSGTYYPIGNKISDILNANINSTKFKSESSNGSIDNIKRLQEGKADLAIIQNDIAYYAANEVEMFKGNQVDNLRAIASLYPETCQFVTLESSNIKSIEDLRGKKVAVGAKNSGAEANARQILEAYNITYNDIDEKFMTFAESAEALKAGEVEVIFLTAGYPTKAVQDIASQQKIHILPISNEKATILSGLYPYYTKITIPQNTYDNLNEDIQTIAVRALLVTSEQFDEKLCGEIVSTIFNNTKELEQTHVIGRFITIENATKGISLKMNPGAEKFFRMMNNK